MPLKPVLYMFHQPSPMKRGRSLSSLCKLLTDVRLRNLFYFPRDGSKSQIRKQAINHPSAWANASVTVLHINEQEGLRQNICVGTYSQNDIVHMETTPTLQRILAQQPMRIQMQTARTYAFV